MLVKELIARLQKLDPETVVVKFAPGPEGYDEVHFIEGTHKAFVGSDEEFLRENRTKKIKGVVKPDFLYAPTKSKAKKIHFVMFN